MKKLWLIILAALAITAGLLWFWRTTTVNYAFEQVKNDCAKNNIAGLMQRGVAHINGETRELTKAELTQTTESFAKNPNGTKCPYEEMFGKKATKTKLDSNELARLKIDDGYLYKFEGSERSMKFVRFNSKWRPLVLEATFNTNSPATQSAPQTTTPSAASPSYQIQYDSGPVTNPTPSATPQAQP